jgi:sugar phosphate isomerase/epimerase
MWGSSITFKDYPLEQTVEIMADLGFTRVEMWKRHLCRCRTPKLRQSFARYAEGMGIRMGGLNAVGEEYFQPFGSEEDRRKTLDGLRGDVEYALSLGVSDVLVWEGIRPQALSEKECMNLLLPGLVELFSEAIVYSKPRNVRFLVEPHPFTVGMADDFLIALCDSLPAESFGITFDFCHYGVGRPRDYIQAVSRLGRRIQHIHFSDSDLCSSELHLAPGQGVMNVEGLLYAFREIGYHGTLTLDLYGNPIPIEAARNSLTQVKHACEFLGISS